MTQERLTRLRSVHIWFPKYWFTQACCSAAVDGAADRAVRGKRLVNNQVGRPWRFHSPNTERIVGVLADICPESRT